MAGPTVSSININPSGATAGSAFLNPNGSVTQAIALDAAAPEANTPWTSGTTAGVSGTGTRLATNCAGYGVATITLATTSTITGGQIVFEAYDGTNWYSISAVRIQNVAVDTGTYALTGGNQAWKLDVSGFQQIGVRLSVAIVGTGTATFTITTQAGSISPLVQANLMTVLNYTSDSITSLPYGYQYTPVSTNATVAALISGTPLLASVIVGNPGTSWQLAIYDNTTATGTAIWTRTFQSTDTSIPLGIQLSTGLSYITSGTTPGNLLIATGP